MFDKNIKIDEIYISINICKNIKIFTLVDLFSI